MAGPSSRAGGVAGDVDGSGSVGGSENITGFRFVFAPPRFHTEARPNTRRGLYSTATRDGLFAGGSPVVAPSRIVKNRLPMTSLESSCLLRIVVSAGGIEPPTY
jgi:hypothetical protein